MKRKIELPIATPMFSTYHYQAINGAVITSNPSIKNWFYNRMINMRCDRAFLSGYTSPVFSVIWTYYQDNPYLEQFKDDLKFLKGHVHEIIRYMLNDGYYVAFSGIDDYFVEGKSWFGERHFMHDGLIHGYDQEAKTYNMYAYDQNWICRSFITSQSSFEKGRLSAFEQGTFGFIQAIKPKPDPVDLDYPMIRTKLHEYLSSTLEKCPPDLEKCPLSAQARAYGIIVQDYLGLYVDKLLNGSIPHDRMDRRVFRMLWEHKTVMLERMKIVEKDLNWDSQISDAYQPLVAKANSMRIMYAIHHASRRDYMLESIKKSLSELRNAEEPILAAFLKKLKEET